MIHIVRQSTGPEILQRRGCPRTELDREAYDSNPAGYRSGRPRFEFVSTIYAAPTVRQVLVQSQHSKCCYCEQAFSPDMLEVEHFRPKGGVQQHLGRTGIDFPGYYWLAYDWRNLLLACGTCNGKHKKNFFPLMNPSQRAWCHHDSVSPERPLFVNPVRQQPRNHITFDGPNPVAHTRAGKKTIDGIGLRRDLLMDRRRDLIDNLSARMVIVAATAVHPANAALQARAPAALQFINAATQPEAEFSSMAIDYLARHRL